MCLENVYSAEESPHDKNENIHVDLPTIEATKQFFSSSSSVFYIIIRSLYI